MARTDDTGSAEAARAWARSGAMDLTGHVTGAPLCPPTRAAALVDQLATPFGLDSALLAERAALSGRRRQGRRTVGGAGELLRAEDGWLALSLPRREDVELVPALLGLDGPTADTWSVIRAEVADRACEAVVEQARLLGLAAAVVGGEPMSSVAPWWPAVEDGVGRDLQDCVVVDLSGLWAGPLCSHLLQQLGARVIKVESSSRPDGARRGNREFYDLLNAGKKSAAIDLGTAAGRSLLRTLVERADVVVTAARARAIVGLGLDPEALTAAGQAWVAITARGWHDDSVGFGDDAAAGAGLVAWDAAGAPCFAGDAIGDPLCGVIAAAAVQQGATGVMDVSLQQVASAVTQTAGPTIAARHCAAELGLAETWCLGSEPVARPRPRRPQGRAAQLGADNAEVLAWARR